MGFTLLSWQRLRNNNPPAMRVGANSYTKKSPFHYNRGVQATITLKGKVIYMAKKANDLAHTKWLCKYHIVFTPKYRRKIIFNQYRRYLGEILRQLCNYKGVEILEGHLMPDHVHMLVIIPPKLSISSFMGYLKGKSALMMFDRHANLRY
ncbi:IS200/IS605 family transposase, partial [Megasphaera massiliensis]|uniref:IS200/IS605 family transposase n=1 Tax=Megasphaera massiliensis TaxID=1232428 RepID=UPI0026EC55DC